MSGEVDTTTGVKEDIVNGSAIIDAGETGTVTDGLAMQREAAGTVKIWAGGNYCGTAIILKGTSVGVASAVAGDRVGLRHKGVGIVTDSTDDSLALEEPLKPTGTAGKFRKWVTGTDGAELLAGYLERTKDADDLILMRFVGGR